MKRRKDHRKRRASGRMVATLRVLQRELPALRPVKVRRRVLAASEDAWATCELEEDDEGEPCGFLIELVQQRPRRGRLRQAGGPRDESDHSPEWSLAMARLYCLWERLP